MANTPAILAEVQKHLQEARDAKLGAERKTAIESAKAALKVAEGEFVQELRDAMPTRLLGATSKAKLDGLIELVGVAIKLQASMDTATVNPAFEGLMPDPEKSVYDEEAHNDAISALKQFADQEGVSLDEAEVQPSDIQDDQTYVEAMQRLNDFMKGREPISEAEAMAHLDKFMEGREPISEAEAMARLDLMTEDAVENPAFGMEDDHDLDEMEAEILEGQANLLADQIRSEEDSEAGKTEELDDEEEPDAGPRSGLG